MKLEVSTSVGLQRWEKSDNETWTSYNLGVDIVRMQTSSTLVTCDGIKREPNPFWTQELK